MSRTPRSSPRAIQPRIEKQQGTVLIVATVVAFVVVVMIAGMTNVTFSSSRAVGESVRHTSCGYVAHAALNAAFAEIISQEDTDSDGLGVLGIGEPVGFTDSTGVEIGQFMTVVTAEGDNSRILAVAGTPNFANPEYIEAMEAIVNAAPSFLLKPKPGAISIAGPVSNPRFPSMGSDDIIDGGQHPAFTVSSTDAFENIMYELGFLLWQHDIDETNVLGNPMSSYDHQQAGDIELPILAQNESTLSAEALNNYRNQLRAGVLDLASQADRVITSRVNGNQVWGTEANPQVTVIEAKQIGKNRVFNTNNQTVTGHGTLIIKHTIRPGRNGKVLNLDWTGNVYVLGFDGDGSDLMYLYGTQGTINGNLVLLSSDHTEASLEISDEYGGGRISDLTVNGGLLTLAEANSHEAEIEVEQDSRLTVNGIMGLFGSRIEIEASGSDTQLTVNGTLAIGMAQDLEDVERGDDFEFEMRGTVRVTYDQGQVDNAIQLLSDLDMSSGGGGDQVQSYEVKLTGGSSGSTPGYEAWTEIQELIQQGGELGFQFPSSG